MRLVLAEKGIAMDVINIEGNKLPEDLLDLNPYNSVPTLVDRELVLVRSRASSWSTWKSASRTRR